MNNYTDSELRAMVLPMALKLVDQEVYRVLNKCNTTEIKNIVKELVCIIKYGDINEPTTSTEVITPVQEVLPPTTPAPVFT